MSTLHVRNLSVRTVEASLLADVDLDLPAGGRLGVVGPSGAGKSMLVRALSGFLEAGVTARGTVDGLGLGASSAKEGTGLEALRRTSMSVIWQDSMRALNPTRTVGRQVADTLRLHRPGLGRRDALGEAEQWLARVDLGGAALRSYPHQLSGGMRQRVAIVLGLCGGQQIVLADEPTTALDTLRQAECVALLDRLCAEDDRALLFVSHDLAVVGQLCERVLVLADGRVVDEGPLRELRAAPGHAVTRELIALAERRSAWIR